MFLLLFYIQNSLNIIVLSQFVFVLQWS